MATSTTTAQLIREQQATQIEGLRGAQSRGVGFKLYKRPQDFREWAEDASSSCLRRFTIEDLGTYEVPTISDGFTEEVSTQFEVVVAYPIDNRYGTDGSYGLQDIIRTDHARIQALIGINGYGQYVAGHSLCSLSDFTIEKGERVWFAVSTYDVMFYQTVYTGTLYATCSISCSATVTATPDPYTVSASVAASASVTVTSSLVESGYSIDTLTPADIATITGQAAPTLMWLGADASGATELVAGTNNLTDVDSPLKEVNDATLGGLTTEMVENTADSMDAASSAVADVTTGTVTFMWIGRLTNNPVTVTNFYSKRDPSSPNYGFETYQTSGQIYSVADSSTGARSQVVAVDHGTTNAQVIVATRSIADNVCGIWTREGSTTATAVTGTMTNSEIFALGDGRRFAAAARHGAMMIWLGTDGDFGLAADYEAARSAIATALGYE